MLFAEKGNRVKEIDESMIESCLQQGYRIVNAYGKVIRDTIPTDVANLKLAYTKHEETIKELKAQIEELTAKNAELEMQLKNATESVAANETAETETAKPTRRKKAEISE